MNSKIIKMYSDGADLKVIAKSFNITTSEVKKHLIAYKLEEKFGNGFTDNFRKVIAERDLNGVARAQIARELSVTPITIRRACKKFGDTIKIKTSNDEQTMKLFGEYTLEECPECESRKINSVDDNIIYCLSCGNEYDFNKYEKHGYIEKVLWEFID